jgi:hypothetical protein
MVANTPVTTALPGARRHRVSIGGRIGLFPLVLHQYPTTQRARNRAKVHFSHRPEPAVVFTAFRLRLKH